MNIGVLGVNHKSSELEQRECFAKAAQSLVESTSLDSLVLLSTCNRTEIYFSSEDLVQTYCQLLLDLKTVAGSDLSQLFYCYFDRRCFTHLAQVITGIDSVIFGEAEIQRQVKKAYEVAQESRCLASSLHFLFQKSMKIGKEIRTKFALPKGVISLEGTLWELSRCFFSTHKPLSVLFFGYSEINRKIIPFFKKKGVEELYLSTRQRKSAEEVEDKLKVKLLPWEQRDRWVDFDVVISSSSAREYLLTQEQMSQEETLQNRIIFDLSLPRSVDPQIGKHPKITLFNIEEIGSFIEQKQKGFWQERQQIERSIEAAVAWQLECYGKKKDKNLLYSITNDISCQQLEGV